MRNFQSGVALQKKLIHKVPWDSIYKLYKLDAAGASSAPSTGTHNNMIPGGRGCQKAFLAFCTLPDRYGGYCKPIGNGPAPKAAARTKPLFSLGWQLR